MPNLNSVYQEGNAAFKASVANALVHIAVYVGKDMTEQKIIPILVNLLEEDSSDTLLNIVNGINKIAKIVGL